MATDLPLPPAGKDPGDWTADETEAVLHRFLADGDMQGVTACLTALVGKDPARAARLHDDLTFAVRVAKLID